MAKKPQGPEEKPLDKKRGMSSARRVWTVVMIIVILGLTFFVYQVFGVGDASFWIRDVLVLMLLMVLIFLAAVVFVWILTLVRKRRGH